MVDILVRNVEDDLAQRMREMARAQRTSMNELIRAALHEFFKPTEEEVWAQIDRIRIQIGPVSGDSTALIREDRDNDESYR